MKVLAASMVEALLQLLWSEVWLPISCPSLTAVLYTALPASPLLVIK